LCRREGIAESLYYTWSKEFLEAGKTRLAGDTARQATAPEVKDLRLEAATPLRRKRLEGRAREALLHDGFDILSVPVLITSSDGRLIFANLAGEAFLRNSQHLALSRGRLVARRAADRSRLVRLMQGLGRGTGGSLALGLGNGHATWLMAMPLPEARANRLGLPERDPLGLIVLQRRDCQPGATAELLERLLELTPAEAWLAAAISRGETVAESAAARGVSLNTARTHLKSVFSKTGVSRQAELAAMLAGMSLLRDD
jgi:DNA-binding CsgD family transcriptional regulator